MSANMGNRIAFALGIALAAVCFVYVCIAARFGRPTTLGLSQARRANDY